jgi:hypothetical protein
MPCLKHHFFPSQLTMQRYKWRAHFLIPNFSNTPPSLRFVTVASLAEDEAKIAEREAHTTDSF